LNEGDEMRKLTDADRIVNALEAIGLAAWIIALKMTRPTDVPDEIGADITAATNALRSSNATLAAAVARAQASIPDAT
jgi:hypothetical protein